MENCIAIVGMACRFPGGANSPAIFWQNLLNKVDGICEVPKDRWDTRKFYHPDRKKPGKSFVKRGGFLQEDVMDFDPLFFGISPREVEYLDPQQRYLLMAAWEALEDAGMSIHQLPKQKFGVFIGGFCLDYQLIQLDSLNQNLVNTNTATNFFMTLLANRISYTFDFKGPSFAVDTACSSSLVATHLACQSIWQGESEMAIAGGVNIMLTPNYFLGFSKVEVLSEHGFCKAFDSDASGYVRAEGVGVVILKSYQKALADKDPIYALIRATGINQDGQTPGISHPNGTSQETLIRDVYQRAKISSADVDYIEAHGTGTQVGDLTEILALSKVLDEKRDLDQKVMVGSVKTNIGHLEAAAGIAGLMKTALSLKHKKIVSNLHFNHPNPKIDFANTCLKIPTEVQDWQVPKNKMRLAAVNSFGFGGTNAHILLQEVPMQPHFNATDNLPEFFFLPLSTRSEDSLRELAYKYFHFLQTNSVDLADLLYSASMRRSHLSHRLAIIAKNKAELCEGLNNFHKKIPTQGCYYNRAIENAAPKMVFVYSGMGPQWHAMGQALLKSFPEFAKSLQRCDIIFKKIAGWSVLNELTKAEETSEIHQSYVAQPANFLIQIALSEFLKTRGITPSAVVGHSVGEVAAAYVAGALTLKDAILISYHRSRLQQTLADQGTMLATGLSLQKAEEIIKLYNVDIAAINSPQAVTFAGEKNQLEKLADMLTQKGIFNRFLQVNIAYHSKQMNAIEIELKKCLKHLRTQKNSIPFYSTVEGQEINGENLSANYWWHNVRQPVLFAKTCLNLIEDGYRHFVEIGPHPVLSNSIKECLHEANVEGITTQTLNRKTPEVKTLIEAVGNLYTQGCLLSWNYFINSSANYIKLPLYPWQNKHYSSESMVSRENRLGNAGHVFFNTNLRLPFPAWQVELNDQFFPYLNDHQVQDHPVFPGASYVEAGLALHDKLFDENTYRLEDLEFQNMLISQNDQIQLLNLQLDPKTKIYSIASCTKGDNQEWTINATGRLVSNAISAAPSIDIDVLRKECDIELDIENIYQNLKKNGLNYGQNFRVLHKIMQGKSSLLAHLIAEEKTADAIDFIYPPLLDGAFQTLIVKRTGEKNPKTYVPVAIKTIQYHQNPGRDCWCYVVITKQNAKKIEADILLLDENGKVLVELQQVVCQALDSISKLDPKLDNLFYRLKWETTKPLIPIPANQHTNYLLFSICEKRGLALKEILEKESNNRCDFLSVATDKQRLMMEINTYQHIVFFYPSMQEIKADLISSSLLLNHLEPVISLIKEINKKSEKNFFIDIITENAQRILPEDSCANLLAAPLWNLGLLFENENPLISCRLIDKDPSTPLETILQDLLTKSEEKHVGFRNQQRFIQKLSADFSFNESEKDLKDLLDHLNVADHAVELVLKQTGSVENISYKEVERKSPGDDEVEIRVYASPLNFKDLLKIYGQISDAVIENTYFDDAIGMEIVGSVRRIGKNVMNLKEGDTVFAFVPGSFRSYVTIPTTYITKIPNKLSINTCSYIGFMTAYRGLIDIAQLAEGEKVLIHNATGAVGLAAIQIAQWKKAEIFATAGTDEKRDYLRSIGIQHIYDSRSLLFFDEILRDTKNYGVDVVLNAIAGAALIKSFELLAPYGRFIEIGKRDISQNNGLSMRAFNRNLQFTAIDIDRLAVERPAMTKQLMDNVTDFFEKNIFSAIPCTVFKASETSEAFRFMGQSKHIGKVLITYQDDEIVLAEPITPVSPPIIKPEQTYLITGGTSGFGLAVAEWLASQGATHLVIASRKGPQTKDAKQRIAALQKYIKVFISETDVSLLDQVQALCTTIQIQLPPLKGIFHSAMVLDDGYLVDMTTERFMKVLQPKVDGALNLHHTTQHSSLDYFVMFSSSSSLVGNPGQANYVVANGFLDAFAYYRSALGLPTTTINWSVFSETGVAARHSSIQNIFKNSGINGLSTKAALVILNKILQAKAIHVGILDVDWSQWFQSNPLMRQTSFFSELFSSQIFTEDSQIEKIRRIIIPLAELEKIQWIENRIKELLGKIIKMDVRTIENKHTFSGLGVDSLMSAEFLSAIQNEFGISISVVEFLNDNTVAQLAQLIKEKLFTTLKSNNPYSQRLTENSSPEKKNDLFEQIKSTTEVLLKKDLLNIEKNVADLLNPSLKTRFFRKALQSVILSLSKLLHTIEVKGLDHLPKKGSYIICPNHSSYLDGVALHVATRNILNEGIIGLLAEDIYESSPIFSLINEMIPFAYRNSIYDLYKNLKYIELCKNKGRVFVAFPEGELTLDGQLKQFKTGMAWLAKQADLTIYPAYIAGTFELMPKGSRFSKPGKISVTFGPALQFESENENATQLSMYERFTDRLYTSIKKLQENVENL